MGKLIFSIASGGPHIKYNFYFIEKVYSTYMLFKL